MDVNMPILNGIETTQILKNDYPNVKVLALSIDENETTILNMLRAGARGYLLKDTKRDILETALNQLMEKGFYHTNTVTQMLIGSLSSNSKKLELKENEVNFLNHACTEMTYNQIADKMCLSPKTIEGYRDSVYEKLDIHNRIGLVLFAIREGYFTP